MAWLLHGSCIAPSRTSRVPPFMHTAFLYVNYPSTGRGVILPLPAGAGFGALVGLRHGARLAGGVLLLARALPVAVGAALGQGDRGPLRVAVRAVARRERDRADGPVRPLDGRDARGGLRRAPPEPCRAPDPGLALRRPAAAAGLDA